LPLPDSSHSRAAARLKKCCDTRLPSGPTKTPTGPLQSGSKQIGHSAFISACERGAAGTMNWPVVEMRLSELGGGGGRVVCICTGRPIGTGGGAAATMFCGASTSIRNCPPGGTPGGMTTSYWRTPCWTRSCRPSVRPGGTVTDRRTRPTGVGSLDDSRRSIGQRQDKPAAVPAPVSKVEAASSAHSLRTQHAFQAPPSILGMKYRLQHEGHPRENHHGAQAPRAENTRGAYGAKAPTAPLDAAAPSLRLPVLGCQCPPRSTVKPHKNSKSIFENSRAPPVRPGRL
jgi:hypothetical protein